MQKSKILRLTYFLLALSLLWFLVVDMSWFVETCDDCFYSKDIIEYRLFTFPLYSKVLEHKSVVSFVADELGVSCTHVNLDRLHKQRRWGLLICYYPCKSGITSLKWHEESYYQRNSDKIKLLVNSNPRLPEEFRQRVLVEHDREYWKQLKNKLFLQKPTDSEPK